MAGKKGTLYGRDRFTVGHTGLSCGYQDATFSAQFRILSIRSGVSGSGRFGWALTDP